MTIVVYTESGSRYTFVEKNEKWYFFNRMDSGEVISFSKEIRVGEILDFHYLPPNQDPSVDGFNFCKSTPVKEIVATF